MSDSAPIRLLLTGGGTGGHLFPAVAAAQAFRRRFPGTEVLFIGTKRKVDTSSLAAYGFASETISSHGFKGKSLPDLIKAIAILPYSYIQARNIIKRFQPDVLLGVGGYVTGPVIVAAHRLGVPVVIHEQNSVPGLANRKLAAFASRICLSLPGSGGGFSADRVVYTGNPVRQAILELAGEEPRPGDGAFNILILGGSQGAVRVNELVIDALNEIGPQDLNKFYFVHQTGETGYAMVADFYRQHQIPGHVQPFFQAMDEIYRKADLLVSRAGATTLSEIAVLGKPAILIPYPFAADNHQEKNAAHYVDGGGAVMFRQDALTGKILAEKVLALAGDTGQLHRMSVKMKELAFPDAAERIVDCCLAVINRAVN